MKYDICDTKIQYTYAEIAFRSQEKYLKNGQIARIGKFTNGEKHLNN